MPVIKLHLEDEEYAPVRRFADLLHVMPEDIVFAGLNQMMLNTSDPQVSGDILHGRRWRPNTLPSWADSSRSVHAYEGKPDQHSEPRI